MIFNPQPKEPKPIKDRAHLNRVKQLPCVICNAPPPSDAHHCISNRFSQKKACDHKTIPLCKPHHQHGPEAIHNGKASWEAKHGFDTDYLDQVDDMLGQWL